MKPRILFIMHMPPPVHGASMVGQFIHDSHEVNAAFDCHYVNMAVASRLEDVGKGGWHKMAGIVRKLMEIRRAVKNVKPDMVYITPNTAGAPFYKDFITVTMLKMMRQRVVMHFHNKGVATRQHRWIDNILYRRYFKGVRLILLADALYADVEKYICRSRVFVCHNAIPEIAMATDAANHQNLQADEDDASLQSSASPRILWLTNIMRTKGIMEYLSALRLLKDRGVDYRADFVGGLTKEMSGEEFDMALTALGLAGRCTYYGPQYGKDKYQYFRRADIFVLPSYTEALPVSILEAMQFGLPVVASNVGGVSAEVDDGENGYLLGGTQPIMLNTFRPDPKEIADRLETLLKDASLRRRMGKRGREKFEQEFTLDVFERRFIDILRQCVD